MLRVNYGNLFYTNLIYINLIYIYISLITGIYSKFLKIKITLKFLNAYYPWMFYYLYHLKISVIKILNRSAYSSGGLQEIPSPCVTDLKKCSNFFFALRKINKCNTYPYCVKISITPKKYIFFPSLDKVPPLLL